LNISLSIMYEYLIVFILAFIVSFCATPIVRRLAFKVGAVDIPKDNRRMHKKPIALMGGAAIITGFVVSIIFNLITSRSLLPFSEDMLGMLAGMVIISIMGVLDDIFTLNAKTKLLFQLAAAITAVLISGARITIVTNPFAQLGYTTLNPIISYIVTILWIVGITNAINLIDGLDGLAAGVSAISCLSLFFISILRADIAPAVYTAILTAALGGAALGFLPFNFNPAKIFMGETGAAFLGFALGVISIQGTLKSFTAVSIAIPLLVLGLPIFDTITSILRRLRNGKSFMEADRDHLHHRLIDLGLSQRQSVAVMYTASAVLGLCAIVLADKGAGSAILLLLITSVFIIGGAKFLTDNGDGHKHGDIRPAVKEEKTNKEF
jgi:UDP-GlcNAc:undecaprenyl-phosphate GlcNAc-1-phosphate transferase